MVKPITIGLLLCVASASGCDGGSSQPGGPSLSFDITTVDELGAGARVRLARGPGLGQLTVAYLREPAADEAVTCPDGQQLDLPHYGVYSSAFDGAGWSVPRRVGQSVGTRRGLDLIVRQSGTVTIGYLGGALSQTGCASADLVLASSGDGETWSSATYVDHAAVGQSAGEWLSLDEECNATLQAAYHVQGSSAEQSELRYGAAGELVQGFGAGLGIVLLHDALCRPLVLQLQQTNSSHSGSKLLLNVKDGVWRDLLLDPNGAWDLPAAAVTADGERFAVAYCQGGARTLAFLETADLADWPEPTLLDPEGQGTGNGQATALAFDSQGNPAVSYRRCTSSLESGAGCDSGADDALMLAYRRDGAWTRVEVDTGAGYRCGEFTALTFDDEDAPVIAYQCQAETAMGPAKVLKVARGRWQ